MKLSDIATIKTNFPEADFWIVRRGSSNACGKPVEVFNEECIGIRVTNTNIILPRYLFYVMEDIYNSGHWKAYVRGTTALVHIQTSNVRDIELVIS